MSFLTRSLPCISRASRITCLSRFVLHWDIFSRDTEHILTAIQSPFYSQLILRLPADIIIPRPILSSLRLLVYTSPNMVQFDSCPRLTYRRSSTRPHQLLTERYGVPASLVASIPSERRSAQAHSRVIQALLPLNFYVWSARS